MTTWSYRWVKYPDQGEEVFLHEVYYDAKENIIGFSENPTYLLADSEKDIQKILDMVARDSKLPVVDFPRTNNDPKSDPSGGTGIHD